MNELIDRLVNEANLNPEQAKKAVETIANFVKEKFPMLGGAVDQVFGAGNKNDE
jgi:polyhydroxyalkanoate synthesis regulator phasin